jgi:hypothetical protein
LRSQKGLGSFISHKLVSQAPFGSSMCRASLNFMQFSLLVRDHLYHHMSKSRIFWVYFIWFFDARLMALFSSSNSTWIKRIFFLDLPWSIVDAFIKNIASHSFNHKMLLKCSLKMLLLTLILIWIQNPSLLNHHISSILVKILSLYFQILSNKWIMASGSFGRLCQLCPLVVSKKATTLSGWVPTTTLSHKQLGR